MIEAEQLKKLVESGHNLKTLAAELNTSKYYAQMILWAHNIDLKKEQTEQRKRYISKNVNHKTINDICKELSISRVTYWRLIKKLSLQFKHGGDRKSAKWRSQFLQFGT